MLLKTKRTKLKMKKTEEEIEEELNQKDSDELECILFTNNQDTDSILKKKALKELICRALLDEYYWKEL